MGDEMEAVPLSYDSTRRASGRRQAAWIGLLVLGVLTICGGLCLSGSALMVMYRIRGVRGGGVGPARAVEWSVWVTLGVVLATSLAGGITELVCCVKLRTGSAKAGVVAALAIGLQILGIVGMVAVGLVRIMLSHRGSRDVMSLVIGVGFYLVIVLVMAIVGWLVVRAVGELRAAAR